MSTRFVNIDRDTPMLLPPDLRDWVQQDDLAHFLVMRWRWLGSVRRHGQRSDWQRTISARHDCWACSPTASHGLFSSRQIERATYQNFPCVTWRPTPIPIMIPLPNFAAGKRRAAPFAFVQLLQLPGMPGCSTRRHAWTAPNWKPTLPTQNRTAAQLEQELRQLDQRVTELLEHAEVADQAVRLARNSLPNWPTCKRVARVCCKQTQLERQVRERHRQRVSATSRPSAGDNAPRSGRPASDRHDHPPIPTARSRPPRAALHSRAQRATGL